jgi:phosphoglycolate phosphatase
VTAVTALVLFDLDGTLTDAAPGILASIRHALDEAGVAPLADDVMRGHLGPPLDVTFREEYGMSPAGVDRAITVYRERYHDIGMFENAVYPGIPELLMRLSDRTLAVATSKPTWSATRILEHFHLAQHFAFIGGATLDGTRSVKADVIAHVLDELASSGASIGSATTTMVGDRSHDVAGAAVHGIATIGVGWGYGSVGELMGAGALTVADDPGALGSLLLAR